MRTVSSSAVGAIVSALPQCACGLQNRGGGAQTAGVGVLQNAGP